MALLSYIAILLVSLALWPFSLVPLVGMFASSLALGIGTAIAAKLVLDCNWQPAAIIGAAVMVMGAISGLMFKPFG